MQQGSTHSKQLMRFACTILKVNSKNYISQLNEKIYAVPSPQAPVSRSDYTTSNVTS